VPTVLENGSSVLQVNEQIYKRFENQQKCAFFLGLDLYIFGEIICQLVTKKDAYNSLNAVSGILVGQFDKRLPEAATKFLNEPKKISEHEQRMSVYAHKEGVDLFYFIPEFSTGRVNDDFGFTIDQIYYHVQSNKVFDVSGRGMDDFTSFPMCIKSTVPSEKWDENILLQFLYKLGIFYDAEIDKEDFAQLKKTQIKKPSNLQSILRLNRPGTTFKTLLDLSSQGKIWLFDMLLQFLARNKIKLNKNIRPSQVFTEEKLKLLDTYSDYFNSSGSPAEKRNRDIILAKLLMDI